MLTGKFKRKDSVDDDGKVSQHASDDGRVDAAMVFDGGCAPSISSLARLLNIYCFPCELSRPSASTDTRSTNIAGLDLCRHPDAPPSRTIRREPSTLSSPEKGRRHTHIECYTGWLSLEIPLCPLV